MKTVSVIVPVFNEEDTILKVIRKVREVPVDKEIIIVDDASTDETSKKLETLDGEDHVRVIQHPENRGRGASIRTGLEHAEGFITIFQDADLELDPSNYPKLIEPILEGEAEVVFGSRFLGKGFVQGMGISYYVGNVILAELADILYRNINLTDVLTMFQVTKTEILKSLNISRPRWDFPIEIMAKLWRRGYTILEVPVEYIPRTRREGKKISWKAFFPCVFSLIRFRVSKNI
ncbi:MAG: glycosyltransferase family 2 protein [Candidatus Aminicenantales bacterium]